ncbi:MAG: polynucleotide adenylyltransferase PcnB [Geobacter sp.]|nr:polynucleotide adenylyltransferase PcnB [Geobacter sp.]
MQPRVIPRQEHGISRKQLSPNALRILYRLRDNGFIAYLVGGCVRDLLLGRKPKDFDIATNATPGQIKRLFRNCRLVGRRFRLAHLHFQDEIIEVATFRAAAPNEDPDDNVTNRDDPARPDPPPRHLKDDDGMVLRDNVFGTPEEDAVRRDFTINALAYNIADFTIIDYASGLPDLQQKLIRPIGDPMARFTEDPVRMLRAIRFAASLEFAIEPATWKVLQSLSATITRAAPARLYDEMLKLFLLGSSRKTCELLDESGLLQALCPQYCCWLATEETDVRKAQMLAILEGLDRMVHGGKTPSPPFFLSALFGQYLEENSLSIHLEGLPRQLALDAACAGLLEDLARTIRIPVRIGSQVRAIHSIQHTLHKVPPRKPHTLASRSEFSDGIAYLRLNADATGKNQNARSWWDDFLAGKELHLIEHEETGQNPAPKRKRKRRRNRKRRPADAID